MGNAVSHGRREGRNALWGQSFPCRYVWTGVWLLPELLLCKGRG